jgi:hypothetical protein
MFAFLRRHQPRNPALAALFWLALLAAALAILFVIFYFLDGFLPAQF